MSTAHGSLVVLEPDVGFIREGHEKVEREIAVWRFGKRKRGPPPVKVAIQPQYMLPELLQGDVVLGVP